MMASPLPAMDWLQQPQSPLQEDDQLFPPALQWWPPTPGSVSPFSDFGTQPPHPMFAPSPFLQPFMQHAPPVRRHHQHMMPDMSPFASMHPHQQPPAQFSPPPSNPHSSPSPFGSVGGSPRPSSFLQPTGMLPRTHSFLKLPAEVRAAIYQELVPDADLHVTMDGTSGKLFSYTCQPLSDAEYVGRNWFAMSEPDYRRLGSTPRECGHLACVRMGPRARGFGRDERGWLSLLLSCKAIYEEFLPYLYARPRLMFDDAATLRRLLESADSTQLRYYVRTLSIAYLVPECPTVGRHQRVPQPRLEDWVRVWQGVSMLESLKHLRVTLVTRGAFANRDYEARVLGPMMLLKGKRRRDGNGGKLKSFDLISFEGTRECGLPRGFEGAPFRYKWRAWPELAGPDLERSARRHKQFVDAQPPYWHHLSSYRQHAFYRGDLSMRSMYSVM